MYWIVLLETPKDPSAIFQSGMRYPMKSDGIWIRQPEANVGEAHGFGSFLFILGQFMSSM
jgi:hypothetical protein